MSNSIAWIANMSPRMYISDSVFIEEIIDKVGRDASKPFLHRLFNSVWGRWSFSFLCLWCFLFGWTLRQLSFLTHRLRRVQVVLALIVKDQLRLHAFVALTILYSNLASFWDHTLSNAADGRSLHRFYSLCLLFLLPLPLLLLSQPLSIQIVPHTCLELPFLLVQYHFVDFFLVDIW